MSPTPTLLDLATPLAMLACLAAFAAAVADPGAAAEMAFLAVVATAVLVPLACLPRRTPWVVEVAALLVAMATIALPYGDLRGAAVGLLLVACAAHEIVRALGRSADSGDPKPSWQLLVAAALALQMLFRSDRLLDPTLDPRTVVGLLALPVAGALATGWLWAHVGPRAAVAAGLLLAVSPGWRVAPTLTLLALAAAAGLPRERRLAAPALLAILVAASIWRPFFGPLLLIAAAVLWARERPRVALGLAAATWVAALAPWGPAAATPPVDGTALWLLLLPFVVLAERRRWPVVAAALALGLAGQRWMGEPAAWAPALALPALLAPLPDPARRLQRLWTGFLLFGAALLAAYPWLRPDPVPELLGRLGLGPRPVPAVALAAAAALGTLLLRRLDRERPGLVSAPAVALIALAVAMVLALPGAAVTPLGGETFVLDRDQPRREAAIDPPTELAELALDSYLSNGVQLPAGEPVARVSVTAEDGRRLAFQIRAGTDTGEWAARREDVAAVADLVTPEPWLSWVAPGGFFAQRYRTLRRPPQPLKVNAVRIELADTLPPDVALAVFGLDLRR